MDSNGLADLFNFNSDIDILGKDIDLSGELNFDLSVGDVDFFGQPFGQPASESETSAASPDIPASPAGDGSTSGQSSVEASAVSPKILGSSHAANSPKITLTSPSQQSPSPQPPQSKLPFGRKFTPIPEHMLVRKCSPPPNTVSPPSSMRPQARVHPSAFGFPQRTQMASLATPTAGYSNMGPPPLRPLSVRRYAPVAPMIASPSEAVTSSPSRKRRADTDGNLASHSPSSIDGSESLAAFDETGKKPQDKKRRLEQPGQEMRQRIIDVQKSAPGSTEGQAKEVDLKSKQEEALGQAREYRRLRSDALEQATEYKRLGTNALQRYNYYKEERRKLESLRLGTVGGT